MVTALEKTVQIGADRHILLDFTVPENIPAGAARAFILIVDNTAAPPGPVGVPKASAAKEMPADAEKIWAYNRAHPKEVREKLQKLRGSISNEAFDGLDGTAYQQKVRAEWDR